MNADPIQWSQEFQFTEQDTGYSHGTDFYISNAPGTVSLGDFSGPNWTWGYVLPPSVLPLQNFVWANGLAVSDLTFTLTLLSDPSVPSYFEFDAWTYGPSGLLDRIYLGSTMRIGMARVHGRLFRTSLTSQLPTCTLRRSRQPYRCSYGL